MNQSNLHTWFNKIDFCYPYNLTRYYTDTHHYIFKFLNKPGARGRKTEHFIYKSEWANAKHHIEKKASLWLHSNNFGLKQPSTTIKTFHYYGT